jgi:hypothetical protein
LASLFKKWVTSFISCTILCIVFRKMYRHNHGSAHGTFCTGDLSSDGASSVIMGDSPERREKILSPAAPVAAVPAEAVGGLPELLGPGQAQTKKPSPEERASSRTTVEGFTPSPPMEATVRHNHCCL